MRYRQVHLDFHTSENIENIGCDFSPEDFKEALRTGHVDSITVFSKCHHGWSYHPTDAGKMHPHLSFDLLGSQITAAHEAGVKTPVYISAGIDERTARLHPEWLVRNRDESTLWARDFTVPGYHKLCLNSPYLDCLLKQIVEVCERYDADGIFLDIAVTQPCFCQNCVRDRLSAGLDPYDSDSVMRHAEEVYAEYTRRVREAVDSVRPGLPVFHNSGHVRRGRRDLAHMNSHLELESLPTGGWGYDHFPLSAAYARTLDMDFLGMTGKFHTSWGEFGGFKHPNALKYETALSSAMGGASSIGDQLHPSGKMDPATYSLIGSAYEDIEKCEPWLHGCKNISDIGIFSVEAADSYYSSADLKIKTKSPDSDPGCARILLECGYLFDAVDIQSTFENYKLMIFPDSVRFDAKLAEKVSDYMKRGGKILLSGSSGLHHDRDEFAVDVGVDYISKSKYRPTYLRPKFDISPLESSSFVMYTDAHVASCRTASAVGDLEEPYFNRSVFEFSSHLHAPTRGCKASDGIFINDNGAYIAWDIFEDYAVNGSIILKYTVKHVIDTLIGNDLSLRSSLPAQGISTLTRRDNEYIAHLLYAAPVKRGRSIEVIEDIVPILNTELTVKTDSPVKRVYLAPELRELPFESDGERTTVILPRLECRQIVVFKT